MLCSMLCVLSLGAVQVPAEPPKPSVAPPAVVQPAVIQEVPGPVAGQWEVRLRTVDAEGKRIPDCAVYFVRADAPQLRPMMRPKPLVRRSNERGQLFTKLPAGHAWRTFAWQSRPGGPIASDLTELCGLAEVRNLVLDKPQVRSLQLKGLSQWRDALPSGLELWLEVEGLLRVPVALPQAGGERVELPAMPRGPFSVVLEHAEYGTVDRMRIRIDGSPDLRVVTARTAGEMTLRLGQPVKISGTVRGVIDEPIRRAKIRLLLPEAQHEIPLRAIRTDARGRYELWFPWRPISKRWGAAELLVSAPGHLLHRNSLRDLCQWLTTKTEDRIDPKCLEGLDLAGNRIVRLERAFRVAWAVKGALPADRFFIRVDLPIDRGKGIRVPTYTLPVGLDENGRLELSGDPHVRDGRGRVHKHKRLSTRARRFELYLLRGGFCEMVARVPPTVPMEQSWQLDLTDRKSILLQVSAQVRPVTDASFQLVRELGNHPVLSVPRAVGKTGSVRIDIGTGIYWALVTSRRKGQGYSWIRNGNDGKEAVAVKLSPFRRIRVETDHPDPEAVRLPLRLRISCRVNSMVPRSVASMLSQHESIRQLRFLKTLPRDLVFEASPWATSVDITLSEPNVPRGQFRPMRGRGKFDLRIGENPPRELTWR